MTNALGFLAYLVLPLAGIVTWRLRGVRELPLGFRIAIAGAAGAVIVALVMSVMAGLGVEWTRTRLVFSIAVTAVTAFPLVRSKSGDCGRRTPKIIIGILLVITFYGLLTARETTGDLLFFWGPKGVHFYRAGTIDVDYLRDPNHFLAHRDYPPMLPLLFAWSNTLSHQFSWWAAVLLSGLCLLGIIATMPDALSALLTTSILTWTFAWAQIAGGADALLLFFEAITVGALLFIRDARAQTIVTAIALAGAIATKVEGASFVLAVVLALILDRRPMRRIGMIALPPILVLGAWLVFLAHNELFDTYRGPGALSFRFAREVLTGTFAAASYNAYWLPWIAPLLVVFLGDVRRARLPLFIATLSIGATLYYYLHSPTDPSVFWIPSSAQRVLHTPLLMLLLAAAAAHTTAATEEAATQGQVASASTSLIGANGVPR